MAVEAEELGAGIMEDTLTGVALLVGLASSCKAKGHCLDSQSRHMPGLQVWSLGGAGTRGN